MSRTKTKRAPLALLEMKFTLAEWKELKAAEEITKVPLLEWGRKILCEEARKILAKPIKDPEIEKALAGSKQAALEISQRLKGQFQRMEPYRK